MKLENLGGAVFFLLVVFAAVSVLCYLVSWKILPHF